MKKLLVLLLSVLCVLSLAGCANSNGGGTDDGGNNGGGEDADQTVTIKLGCSGPLSGDAKVYGEAVRNAAQIAVDEINESASTIKFDFRMEDDEATPEKAVTAYSTLYDWGMQVSLYTVTSGAGAAVAANYDEDKIFAITPSGSATALVYTDEKNFPGNFQMCFTDPNQGVASADYMAEKFADKKIAVIYKSDDVYSAGVYEKFTAEAGVKGLNVVYTGAFTNDSATDFSTQLTAAKDAGADLVFLPIYYQPASLILKQASDMDYAPVFFGVDGMDGILTLEGFDTSLAEGLYMLTPFAADADDQLTKDFVAKYQEKFGEVPNQFAADAYDCVYAIHQALRDINVTPDYKFDESLYNDMVGQFTTMHFNGLTGEKMTWAENGEVSKYPKAVIITDGVYVSAD
ncbi:MAG: ABC transporter substrate-binding protein [Erysipelotrichaceae bacterium]|nr:ABC transporter substrate-binding protein [Erysipelotrichaceae bacterium]